MCSRYYVDPDMIDEVIKVVQKIDQKIHPTRKDIRPTDFAPVIGQSEYGLELSMCRWGYPMSKEKNLISMQEWKLLWINLLFRTGSFIIVC